MTNTQKTNICRYILHRNILKELNQKDFDFMISIFEDHQEWEMKKGVGIKSISVVRNKYNHNFQLNRVDGTTSDISFTKSISNPNPMQNITKSCRNAIEETVIQFRNENVIYGVTKCPITNKTLTRENVHIDHYDLTFKEMFDLWITGKDIEFLKSIVNKTADQSIGTFFTNQEVIKEFQDFHDRHCKLRAVTKLANLSILRK